jgi:uncharacterized repeat protein (TIGR03803 family)
MFSLLAWLLLRCAVPLGAQTMTVLATFNETNGRALNALVLGSDGNLYGTTAGGGSGACTVAGYSGCGTVFQITQDGSLTTLHNFNITDGAFPGSPFGHTLTLGADGAVYGVTSLGGDPSACTGSPKGCGTIFKITTDGTLTTLYEFLNDSDGGIPQNAPIQASDGNFYGTTSIEGTVYQMTPDGQVTTLFHFPSYSNPAGSSPDGGLAQGSDGSLYGTTLTGNIFKITTSGDLTTLYSFSDRSSLMSSLVPGSDGNFYGTTVGGGTKNAACPVGCGQIFSITPGGVFSTVHVFSGGADGTGAILLFQGVDGKVYGTTFIGAVSALFEVTPGGTLNYIYTFGGDTSQAVALLQGPDGAFYGITAVPGNTNGAVFRLTLGSGSGS